MATLRDNMNTGSDASNDVKGAEWRGQSFTPSTNYVLYSVKTRSEKIGSGNTTQIFDIYATDGSGLPTGSALSTATVDITGWSLGFNEVIMPAITLTSGVKYALVTHTTEATNGLRWYGDSTSPPYAGGSMVYSSNSGSSWTNNTAVDWLFEIWGDDPAVSPSFNPDCIKFSTF
jgi:hypothetical protein